MTINSIFKTDGLKSKTTVWNHKLVSLLINENKKLDSVRPYVSNSDTINKMEEEKSII